MQVLLLRSNDVNSLDNECKVVRIDTLTFFEDWMKNKLLTVPPCSRCKKTIDNEMRCDRVVVSCLSELMSTMRRFGREI